MKSSNKYVKILFRHTAFDEDGIEGAWAMKVGQYYQLDNILFYAKEFSLGDLIDVEEIKGELWVKGLTQESGHSTARYDITTT